MEYVKAGVKQAFIDEYLTVDVSAKVKGIPSEDKLRASLTLDEVKRWLIPLARVMYLDALLSSLS